MVRARKSLGQNFLVDPNLQRKIVAAVDPRPGDVVLEIGPGTGALTRHLAGAAGELVAVDLDERCVAALEADLGGRDDVRIVHANVLDLELDTLTKDVARLKVVGNIPYNITTPILFWLIERAPRPADIVLMVQREVADRILAAPGSKDYGALTVGVRTVARPERLFNVNRGAFRPVPDVDSAVIRITPLHPPALSEAEERAVRTLTRASFSRRRKQLGTILRSSPELGLTADQVTALGERLGLDLMRRPETLDPDEFVALARAIREA